MPKQNIFKYLIGLIVVIGLRLVPHLPNVEPIMSTMMPFSKKFGWLSGFVFCVFAILIFDVITGTVGIWSLVTALTYGLLGAMAGLYFKNKENKVLYYLGFAIVGTIFYDAITGIGIGMIFFHMPFMTTLLGQIPFTIYHLAGNIVLSLTVSPILYKLVIANPNLDTKTILNKFVLKAR